jgi:hypothetical protein
MGVQFTGTFNGVVLTDAYARIDRVAVAFPTSSNPLSMLTGNLTSVYANMALYSAGSSAISALGAPIELPMTSPATDVTMRADLDPGILVVLQSTPGLVITASAFVLDPAPP